LNNFSILRIHIAPVGFEIDRIVLPAIKLKADRVWLITHSKTYDDKGSSFTIKIKNKLEEHKIECLEESADRKDLFDTLRALRTIFFKEKGNNIMVNVSTGSKIQSIAAMMACMMFKDFGNIQPYYSEPERYRSISDEQETEGLKEIIPLPDYRIEIPNNNLIKCLELIEREKNSSVTKKRLRDLAIDEKLIQVNESKENQEIAAYMALNTNILDPLQKWNFVNIEKSGKSKIVSLSKDGKNALKFLNS
jgi:Family of unknown function (DUF6293)